jgi:dolichol-phosphate mannosyltransferase
VSGIIRIKQLVTVVVPLLNEGDRIQQLREKLAKTRAVLSGTCEVEFVFVDDGSTDATLTCLRAAFAEGDQYRIVLHERTRGVGAAFRTGFQEATGSIVCTIDADCSYEPEGLKRLLEEMELRGADVAVASPYHPAGSVQDVGSWRLLLSRTCSGMYRMISRVPFYTYTSIFRAYRRSVIETVPFQSNGFVSAAEILVRAAEKGYRIIEVPMVLRGRKGSPSNMKIARTVAQHLMMIGTILLQRLGMRQFDHCQEPRIRPASATGARKSIFD